MWRRFWDWFLGEERTVVHAYDVWEKKEVEEPVHFATFAEPLKQEHEDFDTMFAKDL